MKTNLLVGLILSLSLSVFSQKVVEYPVIGKNTINGLVIEKVTLTDKATEIDMYYANSPQSKINIPSKTYIIAKDSEEKLYATAASPFQLSKWIDLDESGEIIFKVTFPPLPEGTTSFNYIEGHNNSTWKVYDISLEGGNLLSYLPNIYAGNWTTGANNKWEISFAENLIVYKGQPYKNFKTEETPNGYTLTLDNKKIYLETKERKLWIGEDISTMVECTKIIRRTPNKGLAKYPMPELKLKQDTAFYSGYIANYSPEQDKTGTVYVSNILSHEQDQYLIKIDTTGWFEVNIPMYYAQSVYFKMPNCRYSTFLVPGESITQLIKNRTTYSIGKYGPFTDEHRLIALCSRSYDYKKISTDIGTMSIADYKAYCDTVYIKDLEDWAKCCNQLEYNDEIREFGKRDIKMVYVCNLWNYNMRQRSFTSKQSKLGKKHEYTKPDSTYYAMVNELPIDDEAMLSYAQHSSIVNRLEYTDWLTNYITTIDGLTEVLKENDISPTKEEKATIKKVTDHQSDDILKRYIKQSAQYKDDRYALYKKYNRAFKDYDVMRKKEQPKQGYYTALKQYINKDTAITLLPDEVKLLDNYIALETEEYVTFNNEYEYNVQAEYTKLYTKYSSVIGQYHKQQRAKYKAEKFLDYAGERGQLLSDIMLSRQICPNRKKPEPLSLSMIKFIDKTVKTPFIKAYIFQMHEEVLQHIEDSKTKTGYTKHEAPKTEGEKFFQALIKPFEGKVIYIDFWATWCGPCRSGMQRIIPLKEELKDRDDVVFMYITNPSSPEGLYNTMITDIKGEHYRVSQDEWNYLSNQFKITGIPHYILVNKKGEVVSNNVDIRAGHGNLKEKIVKYANE